MKLDAIVYTSQTGFTEQYAEMLGEKLSLSVYSLEKAVSNLPKGSRVIYLGWIHVGRVKGFSRARKHFSVCAVCGVGLSDTGALISDVRKATSIPAEIPLFTIQGGIARDKLKGMDKLMISMLTKGLASQKQRTEQDERMLTLLSHDASYVREDHLKGVLDWYFMNRE